MASMDRSLNKLQVIVKDREVWRAAVQWLQPVGHDLATEKQQLLFQRPPAEFLFLCNCGQSANSFKRITRSC